MSIWLLYLMTRTEGIATGFGALGFLGLIFSLFAYVACSSEAVERWNDDEKKEWYRGCAKTSKRASLCCIAALIIAALLPSRKDWYLMVGGYYVTHIEGIDQLPQNMVGAMNEFLKEYGQEPERKGEAKGHRV